ncbi:hypothetical protein [Ferrimicrobium sp.]|uniref:hypothetical protein n=1 Tax=Ferrimicrobium sp. TaxID=2926050 RepID=UPI00263550E4|nr:hypothetical protein [Ferrimicrobium sp.]
MREEERTSRGRFDEGSEESTKGERHTKTLAIRVEESLHAQLRFIAQLRDTSITDEIRQAIEARIASAQNDPEIIARANEAREELEREAAARTAAIAGFLGKVGVDQVDKPATSPNTKAQRPSREPASE